MVAKQKRMKKVHRATQTEVFQIAPIHPQTGSAILKKLKMAMDAAEFGRNGSLEQQRFGKLIDAPRTTINDWLHREKTEPIKRFIYGLERLSEELRMQFLRSVCRECPRLSDKRIAHDHRAIQALRALLAQETGLVFISGASDSERTFLLTALGHEVVRSRDVAGIDIHPPTTFVPVPDLYYPRHSLSPAHLAAAVKTEWPIVARREASVFLLNGIWKILSSEPGEIQRLASRRLVLAADTFAGGAHRGFSGLFPFSGIKLQVHSKDSWQLQIVHRAFIG
jgi:hypothetical protein